MMDILQQFEHDKYQVLRHYFGYGSFRPGQEAIIEAIVRGRDCLAVMPTSAGKSLCYQVPALLMEGLTLVISPLISLMQDQVASLSAMGITALMMHSGQGGEDYQATVRTLRMGQVKLLYVAPERLAQPYFIELAQSLDIACVAVDEAHCISQWGNDFRPSYQQIPRFLAHLKRRPVVAAFTATATAPVRRDIETYLELQDPHQLLIGVDRPNLFFALEEPVKKDERLLQLVQTKDPTIVYCATRKDVAKVSAMLNQHGISARPYHAGLSHEERDQAQRQFQFDEIQVIVATNAFGMGIDKSNVRQVIHYAMPKDLESYYQEAGRAGRDGEPAICTLFYAGRDIMTNLFLIEQGQDPIGRQKLSDMIDYGRTRQCLRAYLLRYFGESPQEDNCQACTNCTSRVEEVDVTIDAQKVLACIARMGQRFGMTKVIEVLRGSQKAEIRHSFLSSLTTYGILAHHSELQLRRLISALVVERYLKVVGQEYPILHLTPAATAVLKGEKRVQLKASMALAIAKATSVKSRGNESQLPYDNELFGRLRQRRYELAQSQGIPPFMIFSDATLRSLCRHQPDNETAFLQISGVGQKKWLQYGQVFIQLIRDYQVEQERNA